MKGGGRLPVSGTPPPRMEVGEVRVAEDSDFALLKVCVLYIVCTLLAKFWRISLYVTDDAVAKLYVT